MEVLDHHAFRLTRNEDVEIEEDESENLIQALEAELLRRRFGPPIRLEITDDMDDVTMDLLVRELDITDLEVYRLPGPLDLRGLFDLSRIDRPDLRYPPHLPTTAVAFQPAGSSNRADIFKAIRKSDVLVHHPYESFTTSVQAFLEQAARDPHVLAIKQTLYRTRRQPRRAGTHRRRRGRQAGARPGRGRHGSTRRTTSCGHASWRRPACTWSTGWSASRRTASSRS